MSANRAGFWPARFSPMRAAARVPLSNPPRLRDFLGLRPQRNAPRSSRQPTGVRAGPERERRPGRRVGGASGPPGRLEVVQEVLLDPSHHRENPDSDRVPAAHRRTRQCGRPAPRCMGSNQAGLRPGGRLHSAPVPLTSPPQRAREARSGTPPLHSTSQNQKSKQKVKIKIRTSGGGDASKKRGLNRALVTTSAKRAG